MSYSDAIAYLYGLQKYGIKLGLEKTERMLSHLGNPHRGLRTIHVGGTNGKGSTAAMTASVLRSHGFRVGLFTSPHLVSFTERIMIDGRRIAEAEVVGLTEEITAALRAAVPPVPDPTFFEFVTAMAFLYFVGNRVDWAVMEVGMGGRLDATNVISPAVSVITKLGLDHKEFLGDTLAAVAGEKAGIIKPGAPVVVAAQEPEAEEVISRSARERSAPLYRYGKDFSGRLLSSDLSGVRFDYLDAAPPEGAPSLSSLSTPLAGGHQLVNACLAVKASLIALASCTPPAFNASALRAGLASTEWRGRLEMIAGTPPLLIDGAHNPDAARALARFVQSELADKRIVLVMGVMADKEVAGILRPLLPLASEIVFTAPDYGRAASPEQLAEIAASFGFRSRTASSVADALELAKRLCLQHPQGLVLVTGSFYTIGEAKKALGEAAVLGTLRETL